MSLADELREYAAKTHREVWSKQNVEAVPDPEDLSLSNQAKLIDSVVLYADLAESTELVSSNENWFAAEIYKNYLYAAARIIRSLGGTITAYDGDRVMGVFVGSAKNSQAAKCGLKINWVVREILQPAIRKQYPGSKYTLQQKVGVDASQLFVTRTGIRGSNDLVWVGNSANNAAKMAALSVGYPTYISSEVYGNLNAGSKLSGDGQNMWTPLGWHNGVRVYGSSYWWEVP